VSEIEEQGWVTARTLAETLPYIQIYDRETVVIKYGGHAMGEEQVAKLFAADAVLLKMLGVHPVVVHGGGPQISAWLAKAGVKSTFVDGLRVTDEATMEVAEMVLSGAINKEIASWITQAGATLSTTYGSDHLKPAERINRYLDDALGPERYARVVTLYRTCLKHRRPAYSISTVQDADNKDVSYERLLLPFGRGDAVEQIVGSYKSISIEGGFKINNLMGLKPKAVPVIKIRAIIDRGFVPTAANRPASDEVVEFD